MKLLRIALLYVIIIMLVSCGKEDTNSIIPGYIKPGDFRPRGIIGMPAYPSVAPKSYNLTDSTFTGGDGSCSGQQCLAVYGLWSTDNIPVEGIAIRDNDTINSRLLMKLTRVTGTNWDIRLTYKGIAYENSVVVDSSYASLSFCTTIIPTQPAYDPDNVPGSGDEFTASATFLVKATFTVIKSIVLQTKDKSSSVTLNPGDSIVALAHSAIGSTACP